MAQTKTTTARERIAEVMCSGYGSFFIRDSFRDFSLTKAGRLLERAGPGGSTSATDAFQASGDLVVFCLEPVDGVDK
jgi:hypothetical protein